jgi:hypothetical protein
MLKVLLLSAFILLAFALWAGAGTLPQEGPAEPVARVVVSREVAGLAGTWQVWHEGSAQPSPLTLYMPGATKGTVEAKALSILTAPPVVEVAPSPLAAASDAELVAEVRRRGLTVEAAQVEP